MGHTGPEVSGGRKTHLRGGGVGREAGGKVTRVTEVSGRTGFGEESAY